MRLFKRSPREQAVSAARPDVGPAEIDLDAVRAEWRGGLEEPQDATMAWRNGMRLFDDTPDPGQRWNIAEYMARALAHSLFDAPVLTVEEERVTVTRMVELLDGIPAELVWDREHAPKLKRLAVAVARERGWA